MCSNQLLQKKSFPWGSHLHWQQNTAGSPCQLDQCRHLLLCLERKPSHLTLLHLLPIMPQQEGSALMMLNQMSLILSLFWEKMETFIILFIEFHKSGKSAAVFKYLWMILLCILYMYLLSTSMRKWYWIEWWGGGLGGFINNIAVYVLLCYNLHYIMTYTLVTFFYKHDLSRVNDTVLYVCG